MSLQPIFIAGSAAGLEQDKKPYLFNDQAFQSLYNAYVWREQVVKREGLKLLGRLRRAFVGTAAGNINLVNPSPNTFNIFTLLGITGEPNAEIVPGDETSITIAIGPQTLTDTAGTGIMTVGGAGVITGAYLDYSSGDLVISFSAPAAGLAVTVTLAYYPGLPVMGIIQREVTADSIDQTIFFDTKYSYNNTTGLPQGFTQFQTQTWDGDDADFFLGANYTTSASTKALFVTNNSVTAGSPIRYTTGGAWTTLQPLISATETLFQARIIIPYYGRLLAFNTWEGINLGGAVNFFNRCRFSVIGDPTALDAWRSDIFGKGGFIDAPTNEAIISATFFKNTLIVEFEDSTWQLRYAGQYGLPFIWERISSDFGSGSTYAAILFDQGVRTIGNRAIIESDSNGVQRIDGQIPDQVFSVNTANDGLNRVQGIRDYQRELVFWSYNDSTASTAGKNDKFPNRVLVNNYRNATYAIFRDNVTAFGVYQQPTSGVITWSSETIFWDDDSVFWDDDLAQTTFPKVVSGNQQGFVHYYGDQTLDDASLSITGVTLSAGSDSVTLTVVNHNLEDVNSVAEIGDIVLISGMKFINAATLAPLSTDLNDKLYQIAEVIDVDTVVLSKWNTTDKNYQRQFTFTPVTTATYVGGGKIALIPRLYVQTKDFNPFQTQSRQMLLSYVDFLTEVPEEEAEGQPLVQMSVQVYGNTSLNFQGNIKVGNREVETTAIRPYYPNGMDYGWHRFYATMSAQYITLVFTYDDDLMNQIDIHKNAWILHAFTLWCRAAGKLNF